MKEEKKKMLAEKYAYFQMLLNNMTQQREKIEVNLQEIEATLEIVSRITKDEEIVFSLGSNVFGSGKLTSEKFLVNIGLNILIETNKEKTLEILKRNKEILENPDLLRNSIYEKGWILKITPFELQDLIRETNIDKNAYKWFLKEIEKLEDFLTSHNISNKPAFSTLQDGKIKIEGLLENFDDFAWMDFEEKFLKRR